MAGVVGCVVGMSSRTPVGKISPNLACFWRFSTGELAAICLFWGTWNIVLNGLNADFQ